MTHTDIKWLPAKYFIYLIKEGTDKIRQLIHRRSKNVPHSLSEYDGINFFKMENWSLSIGQKSAAFQWAEHAFLLGSVFGQ